MLEDLWTSILDFTSQFVIPDWGGLIALLPVAIFALVALVILIQFWRLARAAPAHRGKGRIEPRTPDGIHMPGPSFAPIFAAVGAFLLFLGVVFGGLTLLLGAIALAIGLLYWLRESTALYERDVERTQLQLPDVVHDGPPEGVHMPGPSFRPLIAALGAALLLAGLVFGPWLLAAGIIALSIALLGWLRDATGEYRKVEEADETGHLENLPDPRMPSLVLAVFAVLVVGAVLVQTGAFPPGQASGGEPGASPGASAPPSGGGGGEGGGGGGGGQQPGPSIPAADVTITAQGIKYLESSFDAPADTPFTIAFVNLDPGTAHNVAIHEGSATGTAVFTGEVFNGVGDQGLRRRPDPCRHVHVRLLGAPVDDRHRQHQVTEDAPRLAVRSSSRCWSRSSPPSVSVAFVALSQPGSESGLEGKPAPAIEGTTLDGKTASLADLRGSPVIVNFWGPSCIPCRDEFPLFSAKLEEHADDGLVVLGVLMDDPPEPARDFVAKYDASWPTVIDPDESIQDAYLTLARPTSYFIDGGGVLRSIQIGELRDEDFERQYELIAP